MKVKSENEVTQSCPTLPDPKDRSLPGSSAHGIFQARVLEWGAIAFSGFHMGPPQITIGRVGSRKSMRLQPRPRIMFMEQPEPILEPKAEPPQLTWKQEKQMLTIVN